MKKRKQLRLEGFKYGDGYTYHVIICTRMKNPFFANEDDAKTVCEILKENNNIINVNIIAFCVMHEHIHVLINLKEEYKKDLSEWVRGFKRFVTRALKKTDLWQKSYYDHIMRTHEKIEEIAMYIVNNPVRKGYVDNWEDYKFSYLKYKE
ncbi:MAG: transposase [Candidatus Omnitrophica bacterium]|nr:transposase [Candidatus Omnitrophota bacterium]